MPSSNSSKPNSFRYSLTIDDHLLFGWLAFEACKDLQGQIVLIVSVLVNGFVGGLSRPCRLGRSWLCKERSTMAEIDHMFARDQVAVSHIHIQRYSLQPFCTTRTRLKHEDSIPNQENDPGPGRGSSTRSRHSSTARSRHGCSNNSHSQSGCKEGCNSQEGKTRVVRSSRGLQPAGCGICCHPSLQTRSLYQSFQC